MKLNARHLLILLIVALLGCSLFTCKMIEGLSGRGGATDTPVDSQTLNPSHTTRCQRTAMPTQAWYDRLI